MAHRADLIERSSPAWRRAAGSLSAALLLSACAAGHDAARPLTPPARPVAAAQPVCEPVTVAVYFDAQSASLTPEALAVLRGASDHARGCKLSLATVTGLADAAGAPAANLALSEKRAKAVRDALARSGLRAARTDIAAAGASGATTSDGQAVPLRRRVDIALTFDPA